ncbi:MAG: uroporphyrinogen decarboxylase family protein [Nanoarchaeota archaeon]|nr:uroporphyrinogen decarboxylase family protein [Nanoarchaeota archaeon]MBU1030582.1 uroporphyrinogen decarboxylase family protein [Nanoarchaeota archaeon]MBU1849131.1 uroporphyrinogen decarboxylase family protein [Nanoarchaeota archaeon]
MGLPGVRLAGTSVKMAQQNHQIHFRVIKKLVDKFSPDMIPFLMDLSVEANALGMYTIFPVHDTATVHTEFNIEDKLHLQAISDISISSDSRVLSYVKTMELMNAGLPDDMIKIAYVTGPYTLAALMMDAQEAAIATLDNPVALHNLCEIATNKIQEYVRMLTTAGANSIVILEPTAVMLGPKQFREFSGHYVNHIVTAHKYSGVSMIYHTCGNTMNLISEMVNSGIDGISLDSEDAGVQLQLVAEIVSETVVVIGNISPTKVLTYAQPEEVTASVNELLDKMKPFSNFILSSGCDLPQEAPLENIAAFMNAGRNYKF